MPSRIEIFLLASLDDKGALGNILKACHAYKDKVDTVIAKIRQGEKVQVPLKKQDNEDNQVQSRKDQISSIIKGFNKEKSLV